MATTTLTYSQGDLNRIDAMLSRMGEVAAAIGARASAGPVACGKGRSYHEAGTLRMGSTAEESVTDAHGCVHGIDNLFVADAAVFPCTGAANPMLTVTALAYRLADRVVSML